MDTKLRTISKVATNTRTILDPITAEALPIMKRKGDINLLCCNCGAVLVRGIYRGQIRRIVVHCSICTSPTACLKKDPWCRLQRNVTREANTFTSAPAVICPFPKNSSADSNLLQREFDTDMTDEENQVTVTFIPEKPKKTNQINALSYRNLCFFRSVDDQVILLCLHS